jgi:hypothetical protein
MLEWTYWWADLDLETLGCMSGTKNPTVLLELVRTAQWAKPNGFISLDRFDVLTEVLVDRGDRKFGYKVAN